MEDMRLEDLNLLKSHEISQNLQKSLHGNFKNIHTTNYNTCGKYERSVLNMLNKTDFWGHFYF